jgi:hypothetical protein
MISVTHDPLAVPPDVYGDYGGTIVPVGLDIVVQAVQILEIVLEMFDRLGTI